MSRLIRRDAAAGIFLMMIGVFFLVTGRGLDIGTVAEMGPGFIPLALAGAMSLIGAIITVVAIRDQAEDAAGFSLPAGAWRVLPLIILAVLAFAVLLRPAGYLVATAVLVAVSSLASPQARRHEVVISAVAISVVTAVAFVMLLGLPIPLLPEALS